MRRNIAVAFILCCVLLFSGMVGCGSKTDGSTSKYASWTGADWKAASDDEKASACKWLLVELTKSAAEAQGQEFTSKMEDAITDEQIAKMVASLDKDYANNESLTLQNFLDASVDIVKKKNNTGTQ